MNKFGLGNIVAAEMDKIMGSKEHDKLFSKAEKDCKCSPDCKCKENGACSCDGKCEEDCKSCGKQEKSTIYSFQEIVDTLISVSKILDNSGFRKSSISTLEALDKTYVEVEKLLSKAQVDEEMLDEVSDKELDRDLGDLGELEAMLDASEDLEDVNDAKLLDELGLRPLEEDPELTGMYSSKLSDQEKELLQHVGGEGFEEESDTDIDDLLGNSLSATEPVSSGEIEPALPKPAKIPPSEEEMQEQFEKELAAGKRNPYYIHPGALKDLSTTEDEFAPVDREGQTISSFTPEIKKAFDKLDAWMIKHAHDFDDLPPESLSDFDDVSPDGLSFKNPEFDNEKIRVGPGDWKSFEELSPEDQEEKMRAGLQERTNINPDQLSYDDIEESLKDEDFEDDWNIKEPKEDEDYDADDKNFEDE